MNTKAERRQIVKWAADLQHAMDDESMGKTSIESMRDTIARVITTMDAAAYVDGSPFPASSTCPEALPDMSQLGTDELRSMRAACDSFDIIANAVTDGCEVRIWRSGNPAAYSVSVERTRPNGKSVAVMASDLHEALWGLGP